MAEPKIEDQGGSSADNSAEENTGGRAFGEVAVREDVVEENVDEKASGSTENEEQEDKSDSTDGKSEDKKTDDVVLTEKGTKLDPDPLSAAHQQLANEKRVRSQMEQVLASPELLAKFMEDQYGIKVPDGSKESTEETPIKEYKAEDFENLDDVAKVVNGLQRNFAEKTKAYETQIKQLNTAVQSLLAGGREQQLAGTMEKDVASLQREPELDPKSSDFIEGLEKDIAEQYHKLDFDENTGRYRGNYSLKEIGDRMIAVARKARAKGSLQAQTIVKNKSEGKVTTSPKVEDDVDEEKSNPADSIAAGISKLFG